MNMLSNIKDVKTMFEKLRVPTDILIVMFVMLRQCWRS